MSTWDIGLEIHNDDADDATVWARLRYRRDALLTGSDFRVLPDVPWGTAPWKAYRDALRDLPDTTTDPREAVWPDAPDA